MDTDKFSLIEALHSHDTYSMWVTEDGVRFDDMVNQKIPFEAVDDLIEALKEVKKLKF